MSFYINHTPYKLRDWVLLDNLNWTELSNNPHSIQLIEDNLDKVNWISKNPNAIYLVEQNPDCSDWKLLLQNPSVFEIDYKILEKRIEPFKEELMRKCFHPERLVRYLETYKYDIGDDEYQE